MDCQHVYKIDVSEHIRIQDEHCREHCDVPPVRSRPRFRVIRVVWTHGDFKGIDGLLARSGPVRFVLKFGVNILVLLLPAPVFWIYDGG